MEPSQIDSLVRVIKRLTVAVWVLVVLFAVYVGIYLSDQVSFRRSLAPIASRELGRLGPPPADAESFQTLYGLPPEEMVKRASVITISRHEAEGNRGKCVLTEILKQSAGVKFYYKVGDEFQHCNFDPKEASRYGEGEVTFFVGSPAEMRYATTFSGERLSGLGDMPISELRALIASEQ
jgi:hypothetical protein